MLGLCIDMDGRRHRSVLPGFSKGVFGMTSKGRKVTKVPHKRPHGDSRRTIGVASKGHSQKTKSVYNVINGNFRVLFPVAQTKISRRRLSSAVDTVVAKMKD